MNLESWKKTSRLFLIIKLFEENVTRRWRVKEIAARLEVNEDTAAKYLNELSSTGLLPLTTENRQWFLMEGAVVPKLDLSLSYPEAASLYLAGRLLAQTQGEQNWHVSMALKKLVEALPPSLKEQQKMLLELLIFDDKHERDMSQIFFVLSSGWIMHRRIRISYQPLHKKAFECFFDPYLLEPSAIGRTVYALGFSSAPQDIRAYKLERIQKAELTDETFELLPGFDAAERLQQAWGVMYDEEQPTQVRLRFNERVTSRVRETRWHPSQELTLTRDGCEWTALIGDTLEIEPWIRGWGSDCEVREPHELRELMKQHVLQAMQVYELHTPEPHDPTKLNRNLFKKEQ